MTDLLDLLTPRQREALVTYARTGSTKRAAHRMGVSRSVIQTHLSEAYHRLGVQTNLDAFAAVGWLQPPDLPE